MFKVTCLLTFFALVLAEENPEIIQASENYYVSALILEYVQAYAVCRRNGLTLATEKNANETDQLNAAITAAGVSSHYHWLGGVNVTQGELQPAWIWLETSELISETHWQSGQPTAQENCLMRFSIDGGLSAEWGSRTCSSQLWFICQSI